MFEFFFLFFLCLTIIFPILFPLFLLINKFITPNAENRINKIKTPSVSILIPAFNEENSIETTLTSLMNLNYSEYEIVVIDDNSTDNTFQKTADFITPSNEKLKLFSNKERIGKKNILNKFIPVLKSDFIFILDANLKVDKNALNNMINQMDKNTAVIYGNLKLSKNKYSSITDEEIHYWNIETLLKIMQSENSNITSPVGGFYVINKKFFEKIPDDCNVEDMFLLLKILSKNKKSKFCKNAIAVENTAASTYHEFNRKKRIVRGGYFIIDYVFKKKLYKKMSKIDFAAFFLNKILRWIYPVVYFLTLIMAVLSYKKNKLSRVFCKINLYLILGTLSEFTYNSIKNYIYNTQNIRVHLFRKPLYFFMLIIAGISAFFEKSQHLWIKENR